MNGMLGAFIGLSVLASGATTPDRSAPEPKSLALAERVWIATRIYDHVNTHFGHWRAVPGLDFDREFQSYIEEALAAEDRRAFDLATMALIAKLRNGHSGFGDRWLRDTFGQPLGFAARPIGGKWVVTKSALADLRPGDVIERINGRGFADFFEEVRKYVPASDDRWQQRALFEYPYLFPASFTLELEGGKKVLVVRRGEFRWPGDEHTGIETSEKDGVLLIRIPSFVKPVFEDSAVDVIKKHGSAKAVILDLRDNHGGRTPEKLVAALMNRPFRWWSESTPVSIGLFRFEGSIARHSDLYWYGDVQQPAKENYGGAVVILINGGCFSACEDFVVPFKDNRRAVILGERSGGSTGQPVGRDLGDGMRISVSAKREFFPDGSEFEGVGIAPDVEIPATAEDFRTNRDPVIAAALERVHRAAGK